uniref:BZIP domain-containing protein n=1 Tax=Lepeophtheirus salmonis TaxID=72036 RepID=A0A0K2TZV6_LEPSM
MLLEMREEEPEDLSVRKRHKSCQTEITSENEDLPPFQKHILLRFSNLIDELRAHRNKEHKARKKRRTYTEFEDENADNDEDDVLGGKEEEDILRLNTPNHTSLHEHDDNHDENGSRHHHDGIKCKSCSSSSHHSKNHNHIFSSKNYSTLIQLLSKFQRANMQMNQPPLYGGEPSDSLCQDNSFSPRSVFSNFSRAPSSHNPSTGGGGGGGDGDFPEFHQHHLSVNTQTPMDFLNNSFHSAIIRSADPDLLFPSGNESLRHHSAPSVRPSPVPNSVGSLSEGTICSLPAPLPLTSASSFERPEASSSASGIDHPEFIHYPTNNDTAISGPVISPHDGCPYPNGPLYGGEAAASGLPPYPQLNHSYAVPPQQQQRLPPAFIKQEIKTDLPSESNNNSNNINNNNELKRTLDHGFRNSTLVKTEKDAYSSSSSTSSSSSSSFKNSSNSSFSSAFRSRYSKDEKRARDIGVPFSVEDIVSLPMDEYNDMIARHALTDDQLSLCRDIRRRGKNKVAAQNCRKRKIHQITELKTTIDLNREIQNRLIEQRSHLIRIREEYTELVLDSQRQYWSKSKYDPDLFEFRFSDDGSSVAVVPKISTTTREDVSDTNYRH